MSEPINKIIEAPLRRTGDTLRILQECSDELEQATAFAPITCRDKCAACCRHAIAVSYLEAVEMVRAARRNAFFIDRITLDEDARLAAKLDMESPQDKQRWFSRGRPCTFQKGMSCGIYRARPLQCRVTMVVSPAENCGDPNGTVQRISIGKPYEHPKPGENWPGEKAFARLRREHLDHGCTPIVAPMPVMVKAVLDGTPTSEIAKWRGSISMVSWDEQDAGKAADARRLGRTRAQAPKP